jgi:outer membrane protein TolC
LGKSPHEKLDAEFSSFPKMPNLPQTGVPADLINRRPDVQASFARLKASDRELAAAISSQYPRLTLNTNLAFRTNNFSNLLDSWAYSLAGNLLAPLFYGGRFRAEVDRTTAVKEQQLYEYGQVVLGAFRDVEDAIVQENNQRETVESIERQVELAENVSKQLRARYFNGMTNYLDVLTALNDVQQLKRDLIVAKRDLLLTRISLYRALAGSFETNRQLDD